MRVLLAVLGIGFLAGCSSSSSSDGGADATVDVGVEAGSETGIETGSEAGVDAVDVFVDAGPLTLTTTAFTPGGTIPARFGSLGCGTGAMNLSPALAWTGNPAGTQSFVLTMIDLPISFVHWTAYDIPVSTMTLPEGVQSTETSFLQGTNSFGDVGYDGPCPPAPSTHTYTFHLYAMDIPTLGLANGTQGTAVVSTLRSMASHVLAQTTITGTYAQ